MYQVGTIFKQKNHCFQLLHPSTALLCLLLSLCIALAQHSLNIIDPLLNFRMFRAGAMVSIAVSINVNSSAVSFAHRGDEIARQMAPQTTSAVFGCAHITLTLLIYLSAVAVIRQRSVRALHFV